MRIIVLDDEELALENLKNCIQKCSPSAEVICFQYAEDVLEYLKTNTCDCAFLDVEMSGMNGVNLAKILKEKDRNINIIFSTGYSEYRGDAFDLHASGYILKPITVEKVKKELENLRYPIKDESRITIKCFGNFEVYIDSKPVQFRYNKTKELLAYLIDRKGALCTNGEIMVALFEDDNHEIYLRTLRKDLIDKFSEKGLSDVFNQQRGKLGIKADKVKCDYYNWCNGNRIGNEYRGEYMMQYSWAEDTNGLLENSK